MSVLACSRKGCKNVLCDRLSRKHGYICLDCFEELIRLHMVGQRVEVADFMETEKVLNQLDTMDDFRRLMEREFVSQDGGA